MFVNAQEYGNVSRIPISSIRTYAGGLLARGHVVLDRTGASPDHSYAVPDHANAAPDRSRAAFDHGNTTLGRSDAQFNHGGVVLGRAPGALPWLNDSLGVNVRAERRSGPMERSLCAIGREKRGHQSMGSTYLPSRDSDLETWLNNFKSLIVASPGAYGLVAADGVAITNAYTAWHTAYLLALNPATRTRGTVATKNEKRVLVLDLVRRYAAAIHANLAVSDQLKVDLGLRVGGGVASPVPPPSTYPLLSITAIARGSQTIRVSDQASPTRRARPVGTTGMLLFKTVSRAPETDPARASFDALVTRAECTSSFTAADRGMFATYFARWTNAKGELGPWGPPVSVPIAA